MMWPTEWKITFICNSLLFWGVNLLATSLRDKHLEGRFEACVAF